MKIFKTFEEAKKDEHTIYVDEFIDGIRLVIIRGPVCLCAYYGLPVEHPLAGVNYDELPVNVHGGFTFGGEFNRPYHHSQKCMVLKGYYWYGWDYGHYGDQSFWGEENEEEKKWDVESVYNDAVDCLCGFLKLVRIVEKVSRKKEN